MRALKYATALSKEDDLLGPSFGTKDGLQKQNFRLYSNSQGFIAVFVKKRVVKTC
jgi:hypothetical protein